MARWVGAKEVMPQSMGLLPGNKGQIQLADGSVSLSTDLDLKSSGNIVGQHLSATGGITAGQSSARVMGWSNNPNVILAQSFFHLPSQYFDSWIRHRADPSQKARYQTVINNLVTIYVKFYGLGHQLATARAWSRLHSKYTRRYYFEYIIAGRLPINDVLGLEKLPEFNNAGGEGFGIGNK